MSNPRDHRRKIPTASGGQWFAAQVIRQRLGDRRLGLAQVDPVRALAARHGISIKRADAILRLKGLEASWEKASI